MRKDLVITGVVFAMVGAVIFVYGFNVIWNIEAYDVEGIPFSQFLMTLDADIRDSYQMAQSMEIYGSILLIVGVILLVIGGIIQDKKEMHKSSPVSQSEVINKSPSVSNDEAQNIMRTRYAKGEITKEQYDQMRKDLER